MNLSDLEQVINNIYKIKVKIEACDTGATLEDKYAIDIKDLFTFLAQSIGYPFVSRSCFNGIRAKTVGDLLRHYNNLIAGLEERRKLSETENS